MHDKILILDFGSQVTQLIARRIREAHVYCEIHPNDVSDAFIREFAPKGVILSGSHASTYEEHDLRAPQAVWDLGVPVLGICYGMFTMAVQQGGQVEASTHREFGYAEVRAHGHTKLLAGIEDFSTTEGHGMLKVWMSHGDKVTQLPSGFKLMASTPNCPIAGMADESRGYYGVQFHPEVTHTVQGRALLNRFVLGICNARPDWVMGNYIDEAVARIREQVGSEEVILGLSGGVDSSVAAALIHRAIGDQLTCVFVDHGLLRLDEGRMVMEMFAGRLHAKVIHVDAVDQFLGHLAGVSDPEVKRKIIGREFVEVFQAEAKKLVNARWLAQGTIYPDVIESGGAKTKKKAKRVVTDAIVQDHLGGTEFTVDVLSDFNSRVLSIVPRERLVIRAGVSDKGITRNHPEVIAFAKDVAEKLQIVGPANIQCKWDGREVSLIEVNPVLRPVDLVLDDEDLLHQVMAVRRAVGNSSRPNGPCHFGEVPASRLPAVLRRPARR